MSDPRRRTLRCWARGLAFATLLGGVSLPGPVRAAAGDDGDTGDAQAAGADDGHGTGHVNWFEGMLGESDEYEPGLLFRSVGTPVPVGALLFNSGILFFVLYRFGKQPIVDGLRNRRETIMKGMDAAAKMKREAEQQLNDFQQKLERVDSEIERLRREMRASAEAERQQVLAEAKKRRERMEREASLLIRQELKAARETLLLETVRTAVRSAEALVTNKATVEDHRRLSDDYLAELGASIQRSGVRQRADSTGGSR
jgi:F-type H+-transporting ATPase subunit b